MRYMNGQGSVTIYYLVHLLITLSSFILANGLIQASFRVTRGYRLSRATQLRNVYSERNSATFCSMLCSSGCGSAIYNPKNKTCITFVEKFYNSSIVWSQDPDWLVLYRDEYIQHADWTMVFRAQKEINSSLFDVWTATGRHDDSPLSSGFLNGCYRLDNLGGCKQHFRSSILDKWNNVRQIKLSLYVNGSEVNYIIFDGTSTTRDSWFQLSSIQTSSWTGIKTDPYIANFNMTGYVSPDISRRFVICAAYGQCNTDKTYFVAMDKSSDYCESYWSMNIISYPLFIYTKVSGMARFMALPREYTFADVMAVFVKF